VQFKCIGKNHKKSLSPFKGKSQSKTRIHLSCTFFHSWNAADQSISNAMISHNDKHINTAKVFIISVMGAGSLTTWILTYKNPIPWLLIRQAMNCPFRLRVTCFYSMPFVSCQAEGILPLIWNISLLCINNSRDYLNPHHQGDSMSPHSLSRLGSSWGWNSQLPGYTAFAHNRVARVAECPHRFVCLLIMCQGEASATLAHSPSSLRGLYETISNTRSLKFGLREPFLEY